MMLILHQVKKKVCIILQDAISTLQNQNPSYSRDQKIFFKQLVLSRSKIHFLTFQVLTSWLDENYKYIE